MLAMLVNENYEYIKLLKPIRVNKNYERNPYINFHVWQQNDPYSIKEMVEEPMFEIINVKVEPVIINGVRHRALAFTDEETHKKLLEECGEGKY